jgi:hypothetical protein
MSASPRIEVPWDELATAIRLWVRGSPSLIWRRDEQYEELRVLKRHDPSKAPDPRGDLAAYLTDRFARLDWQVTRPVPQNIFEGIGEGADFATKRGLRPDGEG